MKSGKQVTTIAQCTKHLRERVPYQQLVTQLILFFSSNCLHVRIFFFQKLSQKDYNFYSSRTTRALDQTRRCLPLLTRRLNCKKYLYKIKLQTITMPTYTCLLPKILYIAIYLFS